MFFCVQVDIAKVAGEMYDFIQIEGRDGMGDDTLSQLPRDPLVLKRILATLKKGYGFTAYNNTIVGRPITKTYRTVCTVLSGGSNKTFLALQKSWIETKEFVAGKFARNYMKLEELHRQVEEHNVLKNKFFPQGMNQRVKKFSDDIGLGNAVNMGVDLLQFGVSSIFLYKRYIYHDIDGLITS